MNLQQLVYFKRVAELEHITHTAEELCITQPCLSYAISELEKELGAPLFRRQGRNIRLTKYGKLFYKRVENALNEIELGRNEIANLVSPENGRLVLAHVSALNGTLMPYLVSGFHGIPNNSGIKFDFIEEPTKRIINDLKNGCADIGFGSKVDDSNIAFHPVFYEDLILIVSLKHPFAARTSIRIKEIENQKFISYEKDCGIRENIDNLLRENHVNVDVVCEVVDNIMITGIVSSNLGIAIVPRQYGNDFFNVKAIEIQDFQEKRLLYMMWYKNGLQSRAAKRFIEFVKTLSIEEVTKYVAKSTYFGTQS